MWASNCGIARVHPKITGLEALMVMIENLRVVFSKNSFSKCDKIIIEFPSSPFGSKFGGGIIPVAGVAGSALTLINEPKKLIPVHPVTWTRGKKKQTNSVRIEEFVGSPEEWEYDAKPTRDSDYEHIFDALGMAYWYAEKNYFGLSDKIEYDGKKLKVRKK